MEGVFSWPAALFVGQMFAVFSQFYVPWSLLAPCRPFSPGRAVLCLAVRDRLEPSPVSALRATVGASRQAPSDIRGPGEYATGRFGVVRYATFNPALTNYRLRNFIMYI